MDDYFDNKCCFDTTTVLNLTVSTNIETPAACFVLR